MKITKFLKVASLIGLGTVASIPVLMLTSCSSEPSIKTYEYNITVGGKSINDLESEYIKSKIANISSIAVMLMNLNLSTSDNSLLTNTPEIFTYLMTNSWICGGSTYIDEENRISFGMTEIKVTATGHDTKPTSGATSTLSISKIAIEYGFYNSTNGTQKYTDINQIKNMLNNNPNINKSMIEKITKATYTAEFLIKYSESLEVIKDASDFSMKDGSEPTLEVGSNTIKGTSNISSYISTLNQTSLTSDPNKINQVEVKEKYKGSITSIS